ncbi:hypothetical protein AAVH_33262, partial [Aphelenchoides avenae]
HWGIVVEKNTSDRSVLIIHYYVQPSTGRKVIREDKLEDVADGDKCAMDNSLDSHRTPFSPADVVGRARSR